MRCCLPHPLPTGLLSCPHSEASPVAHPGELGGFSQIQGNRSSGRGGGGKGFLGEQGRTWIGGLQGSPIQVWRSQAVSPRVEAGTDSLGGELYDAFSDSPSMEQVIPIPKSVGKH
jgi:hypothetical protein